MKKNNKEMKREKKTKKKEKKKEKKEKTKKEKKKKKKKKEDKDEKEEKREETYDTAVGAAMGVAPATVERDDDEVELERVRPSDSLAPAGALVLFDRERVPPALPPLLPTRDSRASPPPAAVGATGNATAGGFNPPLVPREGAVAGRPKEAAAGAPKLG